MVKKLLISLSLILSITPAHGMWSGLARSAGSLARIVPARSLRDYAWLKGLTFEKEEKEAASPVAGAAFLEGKGVRVYEGSGTLSELTRRVSHVLDDRLRLSALPGNPLSSATPYYLGALNKAIMDDDVEGFLQSETAQEWHQHHCATKKDLKMAKFRQPLRAAVRKASECRKEAPTVLAAMAVAISDGPEGLVDYAKGLGIDDVTLEKFSKEELRELGLDIDQVNTYLIKRQKDDVSFLHIHNISCGYEEQPAFPICAEESLWTIINFIFYNKKTGKFDLSLVPEGIFLHPELKAFLEKYPYPQQDDYVEKAKQDWMNFISGVAGLKYCGGKNYELETDAYTGLKAFKYCFGITDDSTFSQVGEKLSTLDRTITFTDAPSKNDSTQVTICSENENYKIAWKFGDVHTFVELQSGSKKELLTGFDIGMICAVDAKHPAIGIAGVSPEELNEPFVHAVKEGKLKSVERLLQLGVDVNKADADGKTPLTAAALIGHLEVTKLLLEHGANIDKPDHWGDIPLTVAACLGHLEVTKLLLEYNTDVNKADVEGRISLYWAAGHGHLEVTKLLLEYNADVNKIDDWGCTPLILAANNGHLEVTKLLLEYNADVNKADNKGNTPLSLAFNEKHLDIAELLLDNGADTNILDEMGESLLCTAIFQENMRITKLLLDHGADVNKANRNKKTPLSIALDKKDKEMCGFLIERGADPSNKLSFYAFHQNKEKLKFLLTCGANPNLSMEAAINGQRIVGQNLEIIYMLLDHGADPCYGLRYIDWLDGGEPGFLNSGSSVDKRQNIIDLFNSVSAKPSWDEQKHLEAEKDFLGTRDWLRSIGYEPAPSVLEYLQRDTRS